jgi:hypothetical protein
MRIDVNELLRSNSPSVSTKDSSVNAVEVTENRSLQLKYEKLCAEPPFDPLPCVLLNPNPLMHNLPPLSELPTYIH